jgi:hypothetical protein
MKCLDLGRWNCIEEGKEGHLTVVNRGTSEFHTFLTNC